MPGGAPLTAADRALLAAAGIDEPMITRATPRRAVADGRMRNCKPNSSAPSACPRAASSNARTTING
jgi:hypothetical protein